MLNSAERLPITGGDEIIKHIDFSKLNQGDVYAIHRHIASYPDLLRICLNHTEEKSDSIIMNTLGLIRFVIRNHDGVSVLLEDNLLSNLESVETIEKELEILVGYEDKLNTLRKYFSLSFEENRNDRMVLNG